ncbi:MAG: hypothetical protein J5783_04620 [Lachnospiraceae bacterium]|nr:hypothetical protein [Lachnospiraceae bacterium]
MDKRIKTAIFSLLVILSLVTPLIIQNTVEVHAASKKTVRTATGKQLKAALKNSKVSTIVLRTISYKDITIKSSKAKNKKIIIDAPNAAVTNTARFKSIEVLNAKEYTEAVSGNIIKISSDAYLNVAENVTVKKLVYTGVPEYYDIQKNGSIKSIKIADKNHKSTFDKKTRTLTFDTVGIWTSYDPDYYGTTENLVTEEYPIHYTAVLDESGRRLKTSYSGWATDKSDEYRYDENGNCIEWKQYDRGSEEPELTRYFEYDYEDNKLIEEKDLSSESNIVTYKKVYDGNGRLTGIHDSSSNYIEDTAYTYDDHGLLISEKTTMMWFTDDDRLSSRKSWTAEYTYDKNGFMLTGEKYLIDDHMKYIDTYEYDKDYNLIRETNATRYLYGEGSEALDNDTEYRYEYDESGVKISKH